MKLVWDARLGPSRLDLPFYVCEDHAPVVMPLQLGKFFQDNFKNNCDCEVCVENEYPGENVYYATDLRYCFDGVQP